MEREFLSLLTYLRFLLSVFYVLITLRAKLSGAVYCNRSCLWVCLFVCVCVFAGVFVGCLCVFVSLWVCL